LEVALGKLRCLAAAIVLLVVAPVFGQELSISDLWQKVDELEKRVVVLEQLLAANSTPPTNGSSNSQSAIIANWRKLKIGMDEEAVRTILGEPRRVVRYAAGSYTWFYSTAYGQSRIDFDSGGVASWMEPE